jgi:protein SCO1/2
MTGRFVAAAALLALLAFLPVTVLAQPSGFEGFRTGDGNSGSAAGTQPTLNDGLPAILEEIGIDQRINEPLPKGLAFRDEAGREVLLDDYLGKKPVILNFVYFRCPMLCTQVLDGLVKSLKVVAFSAGKEFDVVTVSIDPSDTPEEAAKKKAALLDYYDRPGAEAGWHILTGGDESIRALTAAAGFRYVWDETSRQYAHASGVMVVTTEGRLYRYFYGVDFSPKDLRLSLVEASKNRIGSVVDQVLLFCYHYDPATGKYGTLAIGALRVLAALTLLALGTTITLLVRRDRKSPPAAVET